MFNTVTFTLRLLRLSTFVIPPTEIPILQLRRVGKAWKTEENGTLRIEEKHQIANFADFCNDCGNCDVFCPEDGGPYVIKPRFFANEASYREAASQDGLVTVSCSVTSWHINCI